MVDNLFMILGTDPMRIPSVRPIQLTVLVMATMACVSCARSEKQPPPADAGQDAAVKAKGSFEVTAKLVEIPKGAIFHRDLYDYATVLKYQVLTVHRGKMDSATIYVGQYNPFKPRSEAADQRVQEIGGNLMAFRAGQVHRMALEVPIDDYFMGGIVNKYFDQVSGPIYWAVWTNLVSE
jgi:hypothetical protein